MGMAEHGRGTGPAARGDGHGRGHGGAGRWRATAVRVVALALAGAGLVGVTAPVAGALGTAGPSGAVAVTGTQDAAPDAVGRGPGRGPDTRLLNEALNGIVQGGGVSAALARVGDHGRTLWKGAAGLADRTTGAPATAEGRFRIGSVTKTFVSTVALQLVAEGRIGLDDPVERLLPGAVPNGADITLRQLLGHTSGVFNYTEDDAFDIERPGAIEHWLESGRYTRWTPQQLVALANAHPAYFAPGQGFHYSNTNYVLVGQIIERATGRSWQREVERRVIRPLGLTGTSMPDHATGIPGPHAHGYYELPSGPADVTELDPSMAGASGAGISTTADLNTFITALIGGRLLPRPQLAEMMAVTPQSGGRYGLGLERTATDCGVLWGHGGGIPGYSTVLYTTADLRRQLAVSMNGTGGVETPPATREAYDRLEAAGTCAG
ncbi:serine hydrolase domain-containing protein [Kitasatospora sp. NPDC056327]|uniref:serine hydrolase domain-containing protein n=1 Tax=Kitasatospora sp. NPDC056327 TaxID=3345785 RepID=UPI0035D6920F